MRIDLDREEIQTDNAAKGLEISIRGFKGDSGKRPSQVFIEFYHDRLAVHVWDGSSEDCVTHIIPAQ